MVHTQCACSASNVATSMHTGQCTHPQQTAVSPCATSTMVHGSQAHSGSVASKFSGGEVSEINPFNDSFLG